MGPGLKKQFQFICIYALDTLDTDEKEMEMYQLLQPIQIPIIAIVLGSPDPMKIRQGDENGILCLPDGGTTAVVWKSSF